MKPDEKIALLLTFITGMFAGGALYVTVFAPQYKADPVEEKSELSIVGELYGGCNRSPAPCPSFRLNANRTYQFIAGGEKEEGKLPGAIADPIFKGMSSYRLSSHAGLVEKDSCSSYVDGIDYVYDVTFEGIRYHLDTCKTALAYESEMQKSFLEAWKYMDSPTTTYPTIVEDGISGWLIERFQR